MKNIIKIILLLSFVVNILNANIEKEEGAPQKVIHAIPINLQSLNKAITTLNITPFSSKTLDEIYQQYDSSISHNETVKFKIGRIFHSEITCEGIKATLTDVIPVMIDILKTALEQIPQYALTQIIGYDITTPAGFAEFVVEIASGVVCAGYAIVVTTPEEALRTTVDVTDKLMLTFSTEVEAEAGNVHGMGGIATETRAQLPAVSKTGVARSIAALTESASEEFSSKLNDCMKSMKQMYNEVITAKIKNFTPYKKEKQDSFRKMAKTMSKKSVLHEMVIKSPIRFHSVKQKKDSHNTKKKKHRMTNTNIFIKVEKTVDDETGIEGSVKLNTNAINIVVADKEKILKVSRDLPKTSFSKDIINDSIEMMNILTDCLNDPTMLICQRISCIGPGELDPDCQRPNPDELSKREKAIPFSFSIPANVDFSKVDSMLLKLRMKKIICLKTHIMTNVEKENFIQALHNLTTTTYSVIEKGKGVAIFDNIFEKEFCNYQFEKQIENYEVLTRHKFREVEKELAIEGQRKQVTFTKIKNLKADYTQNASGLENIKDMCTWFESEGSDLNQDYTSVLYLDPATGDKRIEKRQLDTLPMDKIVHTQPNYPVYGVCTDSNCSKMKCVYDCVHWDCPNTTGPFSSSELNNNLIETALADYKNNPNNKKFGSDEVRSKTTASEYIEDLEKGRMKQVEKDYNNYHNYEGKFSRKVMLPMLIRQNYEDSLLIY